MPRTNIKDIFSTHSTEQFFNRTMQHVTRKDVVKAIEGHQTVAFKRISATKSMTYIHVKREVIKTVMNRQSNKIVTILPWKSIYHYVLSLQIKEYDNKLFIVHLYPDCYRETKKPNAMTKIMSTHGVGHYSDKPIPAMIPYNHPWFEGIFATAWNYFKVTDEDNMKIKKERIEGNDTFAIEGKAKENKTIIKCNRIIPPPK